MSTNNKLAKQIYRQILMRIEIRRGDRVRLHFYRTVTGLPTTNETSHRRLYDFFSVFLRLMHKTFSFFEV